MAFKCDQNYQNTSETFIKQVHTYINFQLLCPKYPNDQILPIINTLISLRRFTWSEETTKLPLNVGINNELYFLSFSKVHKTTKIPPILSSSKCIHIWTFNCCAQNIKTTNSYQSLNGYVPKKSHYISRNY